MAVIEWLVILNYFYICSAKGSIGGRNRKRGAVLGQGYTYSESMEKLPGITLEGVVISRRTAKAVEKLAELGRLDMKDFPLLQHIKEL